MALSFPLSLANFFSPLVKVEATLDLSEAVSVTETQGGEIITASYGARLWQGTIMVQADAYDNLDSQIARAEFLRQAGASFFVTQTQRTGPQADIAGATLGGATPTITAVNGNLRDVTIGGLPVGYVLSQGDLLSFTYLSGPTRYALHRVVTTATANGSGIISSVEVSPPLRPGYSTPMAVTLVNPVCKAVMVPGSFQAPVTSRAVRTSFSFGWRQTLR